MAFRQGVDLSSRNAFARVPFPEYWNIDPVECGDQDQDALEIVNPHRVADLLRTKTDLSVRARTRSGYLVLSSHEYNALPRHPEAIVRSVKANTNATLVHDVTQDTRNSRAIRSGAHSLMGYLPKMTNVAESYIGTIGNMKSLKKEIPYHWLAHMNEEKMRQLAQGVFYGAQDLLGIIADAHSWSEDDVERTKTATVYRLVGGERNKHTFNSKKSYWSGMAGLIIGYTGAKLNYVRQKQRECELLIANMPI